MKIWVATACQYLAELLRRAFVLEIHKRIRVYFVRRFPELD